MKERRPARMGRALVVALAVMGLLPSAALYLLWPAEVSEKPK